MQNRSEVKEQKGMNGDVSTWKARGRRDYIQRGAKDMLVREREQVRTLLIQLIESVLSANLISAFVLPFLYDKKWGRDRAREPARARARCNGNRNGKGETTGKDPNYESHLAQIDTNVDDGDIVLSHG